MKSKGFTLIELLGVIIILSILLLIVLPKVVSSIKSSSNKVDEITQKIVYKATDLYIDYNKNSFEKTEGTSYCISFSDLVDFGYLKSPITSSDNATDLTNLKSVKITYKNNKFNYEVVDNDECEVINEEPDIPSNIFDVCTLSDETYYRNDFITPDITVPYQIEVLNCGGEKFYILKQTDSMILALATYNLNISTSPYKQDSSGNPNQVNFFESSPEVWPESGYNAYYYGENNFNLIRYYTKNYENYLIEKIGMSENIVARLMTLQEAEAFGLESYDYYGEVPFALFSPNYYLGTFNKFDNNMKYSYFYSIIDSGIYNEAAPFDDATKFGIRPLIMIPLSNQIIYEPDIIPVPDLEDSESCITEEEFVNEYLKGVTYISDLEYIRKDNNFGHLYKLNTLPKGIKELYESYYESAKKAEETTESCAGFRDSFITYITEEYLPQNEEEYMILDSVFDELYDIFENNDLNRCNKLEPIIIFDFASAGCDDVGLHAYNFSNGPESNKFHLEFFVLW